jgi:phosphoglycerol transferase MdoB-like AlkP superfamily enzyme
MKRMGLEHKSRPLLPFPRFLMRVLRYFLISLLLIIFSLAIGTLGYHSYGDMPWIDAFYNASMILTGMGPVNTMNSNAAKLFSSFYALFSGIAFLSITAVLLAPIAHRLMHILHLGDYDAPGE